MKRFKPEKKSTAKAEAETKVVTFAQWAEEYPLQQGVTDKRSLSADSGMIRLHLEPFFGEDPLSAITRKRLIEYINVREKEKTVRNGKTSKKPESRLRYRTS